jgi:hypothetical protein
LPYEVLAPRWGGLLAGKVQPPAPQPQPKIPEPAVLLALPVLPVRDTVPVPVRGERRGPEPGRLLQAQPAVQ